jgi:hypothetical protein
MDLFRLALCLGLGLFLWQARIRGVRPVREFFQWGVESPFQFLVTAVFLLVLWGGLGGAFGLQGLFLDEDPLTQVLIGGTVMLLFAAIVVHYVALGGSGPGWWASLRGLAGTLRGLNAITDPARPAQTALANGFLERLTAADIETLDLAARHEQALAEAPAPSRTPLARELHAALASETFRLLVAPAIFFRKGFMLVLLVGLVPTVVIPLVNRDPRAVVERLPWLVGVCLGNVVGIVLCCWTTAWLAAAAGWGQRQEAILTTLRRWQAEEGSQAAAALPPPVRHRPPLWLSWLGWFFVVHAAVTLLLPRSLTAAWIDFPERNLALARPSRWPDLMTLAKNFPWLPAAVLGAEAALAGLLAGGMLILGRPNGGSGAGAPHPAAAGSDPAGRSPWHAIAAAAVAVTLDLLRTRWLHRLAIGLATLIAVASVAVTLALRPEATQSAWLGLRGYASLGAILVGWLGIFWLATHAAVGGGARTPLEQRAAVAGLAALAVLHVLGAAAVIVAPLAATAAILSGSRTLASLRGTTPPPWLRPGLAAVLALGAALSLGIAWQTDTIRVAAGVWLGLAVLFLGSTSLARVASHQPALLYPLTVLLGYVAFAVPYATLGERWKSALPAAGSIACLVALLAAGYAILVHARPRSGLLAVAAAGLGAVLLNGTALFVAPNEFKGMFPNLEAAYALPVYLDSRDYFRDTTPSTAQLRNRSVTEDFDRMARQGFSERLATVYFTVGPLERRPDGSHAVVLEVEDPRSRLRAVAGDTVGLAAEEWFTIRPDGPDLVALAEEPFYRRIYRLFGYDTFHMIRNGIIRGPRRRLVPAADPRAARGDVTPYTFLTAGAAAGGDDEILGLRLEGLAAEYEAVGAEYALIAMNWLGRVAEVRHEPQADRYRVEFTLPAGLPPLDPAQLRTMQSWMERCHLDTLRPAAAATTPPGQLPERFALARGRAAEDPSHPLRPGDCLLLEDARTDAPVPVGVFLTDPPAAPHSGSEAAFAPYRLSPATIGRTIAATPRSAPLPDTLPTTDPAAGFTLRPAHDRGLFASPDGAVRLLEPATAADRRGPPAFTVAVYNAGRLRVGDRLILTWNGRRGTASGPDLAQATVCELVALGEPPPAAADPLPPGGVWARLEPVPGELAADAGRPAAAGEHAARSPELVVGQWQNLSLLNNAEVLLAWKNLVGPRWREGKPKLVIVTVSGGGIRASVWTSVVLRKLEATLGADFPYHIRLVTGASGGMVAGSYYATSLRPPTAAVLAGGRASFSDLHGISIDDFVDRMALDQLDAVAGRMLFADLPATLNPFLRRGDRGRTLEQTWIRWTGGPASPLGRPIQAFAAGERLGWRPSLVFTPMMVEDGRRLLISNLDLAFATRNVGGLLLEPSSRKIERPAIQGGDFDQSIHEEDEVFSLSAVEFFRLFPRAGDFQVTTAIRMSASFPWVSPAFNLPTLPPRRVVDAAYYDNYGINLSALWLSKLSQWLQENTSGVLVVQVRDKVSQGARTEIDFDRVGGDDTPLDRLVWHGGSKLLRPGLQALTTPLVGVTNARQWTMAFRNDEQVDLQDLLFDELSGQDFFRTVVFECPVDVSLNWRLTEREKAILVGGFGRPEAAPADELARVKDYLTGRDSYEFHKWRLDKRNQPTFRRELKARYDEQLQALGFAATDRLTLEESQSLYENVVKNLKRLELLADWWQTGRVPTAPEPAELEARGVP